MTFKILQGDNRDVLKTIESNSIDAIVTDPPYGIDFLGKSWDANTGALETYQECLRVLKPGGHILAFSAARTYHHLAITLEQAGFEIRDQIMWIYSSGFPKSQDIGKSIERTNKKKNRNDDSSHWEGWGTALKPAHEPIALARKPMKLSIAKNCQKHGVGALNIDATRVPYEDDKDIKSAQFGRPSTNNHSYINTEAQQTRDNLDVVQAHEGGRFPSNVLGEIPLYQKYFYCPKVSRKERHIGFDTNEIPTNPNGMWDNGVQFQNQQAFSGATKKGNNHPTVKPVQLMEYLIKLITPPGGTVLDPFNGSGSTGMAAVGLGFNYIGIELDPNYVKIAETRIQTWADRDLAKNNFGDLFAE